MTLPDSVVFFVWTTKKGDKAINVKLACRPSTAERTGRDCSPRTYSIFGDAISNPLDS